MCFSNPLCFSNPYCKPYSYSVLSTQHLRCFDEYVNSIVEGQNGAVKTTNTGTKATYNLDTAVRCLNFRAQIKVASVVPIKLSFRPNSLPFHLIGKIQAFQRRTCNANSSNLLLFRRCVNSDGIRFGSTTQSQYYSWSYSLLFVLVWISCVYFYLRTIALTVNLNTTRTDTISYRPGKCSS